MCSVSHTSLSLEIDTLSSVLIIVFFFFFNDTATTEIYTLSLHDALPIFPFGRPTAPCCCSTPTDAGRSEEHTSELQSRFDLVCRLLLEKKKNHLYARLKNSNKKTDEHEHHHDRGE